MTHTGEKPFKCEKNCGYRAAQDGVVKRHQASCNGPIMNRILKCPDCPAETPIQSQYDTHRKSCMKRLKKFDKSAKFTCTKCVYSSNIETQWDEHKNTVKHNSSQMLEWYICVTCNFATDGRNRFADHKLTALHLKNTADEDEVDNEKE